MTNDKAQMTKNCPKDERFFSSFIIFSLVVLLSGCADQHMASPRIAGRISGNIYTSPQGHFSVPFPVSREVGGRILSDDSESVTFHDNWGSKIGFSSGIIEARSPMMTLLKAEGREKALVEYVKHRYNDLIETHYHPDVRDGAISFIYLKPVGPKTGVAAFIDQNRVYLVETDLLPAVQLLSKDDDESRQAREKWLENRALELLRSIDIR